MILYSGPSLIDGSPIVAIATGGSKNPKTGDMLQVWILRADLSPVEAARTGADAAICGTCQLRPLAVAARRAAGEPEGARCYVTLIHGPRSVFDKYSRGGYETAITPDARRRVGAGRMVRLGAYGDPSAVPAIVWRQLLADAVGHTGYTHQWSTRGNAALTRNLRAMRPLVMASVETIADAERAQQAGWRTFRVRPAPAPGDRMPGERICPASAEAGHKVQCIDCRACAGTDGRASPGIAIIDHGPGSRATRRAA
jgi:hypothetical protein